MKPCPVCGEQIQDVAVKCRFCGEILDPALMRQGKASRAVPWYRKILLALVWWFALFIGSRMIAGGIVGGIAGGRDPQNATAAAMRDAEAFFGRWNTVFVVVSGAVAIAGAAAGVLPGTRRRDPS